MKKLVFIFCLFLLLISFFKFELVSAWGFWGHQRINQKAIYCLPQPLLSFYKQHQDYIVKHAVDPDMRRYADPEEAPRHFMDIDYYGEKPFDSIPLHWSDALIRIGEDSLKAHGIVPYHIQFMLFRLTNAFKQKDVFHILKYSAEIGHYIGDAHVPLHCTSNYNGQKTGQHGIHGFWESRLPELTGEQYNYLVGKAHYISNTNEEIWNTIKESYAAKDSVLYLEKQLSCKFDADKKYSFEVKGKQLVKVYSKEYSMAYNKLLGGMVERRMQKAIIMTASFWYTAYVDAGMPDLNNIIEKLEKLISNDSISLESNSKIRLTNLKGHDD